MTDNDPISDEILEQLQERAAQEGRNVDDMLRELLETPSSSDDIPYKMLLDNITDNITLLDPDLRYIYVNPMLQAHLGREYDEIIGKTDRELGLPEENLQLWQAAWDEALATGKDKMVLFDYEVAEKIHTFESCLTPIYNNGELVYLLAITRDVTERETTQQMLQDITDHAPGMLLRYELLPDGSDQVLFASAGIQDLYEVSVEEALADIQVVWNKVHPDDVVECERSAQVSAATLSPWEHEWRIRMNDGSIKWVAGHGTPRRSDDGRTIWNTLILDITHRKQLEQAQQQLVDQLRLAIETAHLGVWRLNLDTDALYWNERQMEIYGVAPDEFVPNYESWRRRVHPDDLHGAQHKLRKAVTEGEVFGVNFRIIRDDGEIRHIYAAADKLPTAPGGPTIMIGVNMDVTARHHAEQMMLERERLMTTLQVEKERIATFQRIVAKLDHDMRAPLTVITTSQDILSKYFEEIDVDKRRQRIENIGKQSAYLTELLNDLTLIRGVSPDEPALRLTSQNLKMLCQVTVQDFQETTGKHHQLHLEHDFVHDTVLVDSVLLNRILLNLLSNAVKYSPAGSRVWLTLGTQDEHIRLEVRDEGIGMAQTELEHIFTPFYRVRSGIQAEGSGLGLSIVRECVDRHLGEITVESSLGEGTTFTVTLPLVLPD